MTTTNEAAPAATPAVPRRARRRSLRGRLLLARVPIWALIAILLVIELYPLVWLFLNSLKGNNEYLTTPSWAPPQEWLWSNYATAWETGHLGTYLRNSAITVFPSLIIMIAIGVAAAFALEVMVWKGRSTVLLLFLAGLMIPGQMLLLPLFTMFFQAGLLGTLWPLIAVYIAHGIPLTVFMMATYFRSVPREIFEAATIDGAGMLRAFWSIGLPLARSSVLTVALVQFFFTWNDLLFALTFVDNPGLRTVQVGLLNFSGDFGSTEYGPLFAAICVNVFGTLILYLFINQRVMKGLTAGAVKG